MAILQSKAASQGAAISNDVLERIAVLVPTNIRELEGALTKVLAHEKMTGIHLTPDAVDPILVDMAPPKALVEPVTLIAMVAREFDIPVQQLTSASRRRAMSSPLRRTSNRKRVVSVIRRAGPLRSAVGHIRCNPCSPTRSRASPRRTRPCA